MSSQRASSTLQPRFCWTKYLLTNREMRDVCLFLLQQLTHSILYNCRTSAWPWLRAFPLPGGTDVDSVEWRYFGKHLSWVVECWDLADLKVHLVGTARGTCKRGMYYLCVMRHSTHTPDSTKQTKRGSPTCRDYFQGTPGAGTIPVIVFIFPLVR